MKTINKGTAAYARKTFVAKVKRTMKIAESLEATVILEGLLIWLKNQQERFDKKPGGVGRK